MARRTANRSASFYARGGWPWLDRDAIAVAVAPSVYGQVDAVGRSAWEVELTNERDHVRFEKPLYTVTEAAVYVGVPRSTFDTWVHGYLRRSAGHHAVHGAPLLTSVAESGLTIPFVGLAEGMVLAAFRDTGLSLQRIRPALERLRAEHELEYALASEHLYCDGAEVLYDYARAHGDKQLRLLTVVRSGQRVFHEVIERYLTRITYEGGWAARLVLPITEERLLMVDPERAFGQPMFIRGGARLVDVRGRIEAGEDQSAVADDYVVPLEDVRAAFASPASAAA